LVLIRHPGAKNRKKKSNSFFILTSFHEPLLVLKDFNIKILYRGNFAAKLMMCGQIAVIYGKYHYC
jgi:hypothetical protein